MPELKGILWDDGVLVDTEPLYFRANQENLREVGFELTLEDFVQISLVEGRSTHALLAEQGLSPEESQRLYKKRNRIYMDLLETEARLMEGIGDVVAWCAERFRMGIVTSSRMDHFQTIHRASNLLDHFEFILTGEDYTRFKPDPQPYQMGLDRLGLPAEECIVIEDTERGLESARGAGLRCLLLPSPMTGTRDYPRAHHVLGDVREIPDALAKL
jgi:HAD superfamily hydrolase (TIGR01509 family)